MRRGLFDRSRAGAALPAVSVRVERDRIRLLAGVLGDRDPVRHDVDVARRAGHPDLVAPPSFPMVVEAMANEERARRRLPDLFSVLRCDLRYLLHGEERYVYAGAIYAGDEIEVVTEIVGFQDKKNGLLEAAEVILRMRHARRGVVVVANRTLIHRLV
jgi:hypothetical protein